MNTKNDNEECRIENYFIAHCGFITSCSILKNNNKMEQRFLKRFLVIAKRYGQMG